MKNVMDATRRKKLIVVVGPTASGKSDLAVALGLAIGRGRAEIVSADSRQVYRGMDIGTGKVTKREMRGVPHGMLDIASPRRVFTAADYQKRARREIARIWREGRLPIVCGGTGLYIRAAVDGIVIPEVAPNAALRARLANMPTEKLFALLEKKDPARARTIDPKNPRRLVRALEIAEALGKVPPLAFSPLDADALWIGIRKENVELKILIEKRLKKRLKQGMLKEIERLHAEGVPWKRMEDFGLEYRWGARLLQGKLTRHEFEETLAKEIIAYAKRQMTWFKRDKRIYWISNQDEAMKLADNFMRKDQNSKIKSQN